ncbi:hypothetical protein OROGR_029217 [Orobanche gracilis]
MNCRLSKSPLPEIWVIETLAHSNQVDISILLDLIPAGPEMWKWDVQPFVEHKRSNLHTHPRQQLKNTILTGNHSPLVSFKEQNGIPVENQPEHGLQVDDDKYDSITPRIEATQINAHIGERNDKLISPATAISSNLLLSHSPQENFLSVRGKKHATTDNTGGNLSKKHIISKNGNKIRIKFINKHKNAVVHSKQETDGKLISLGVNEQIQDTDVVIAQQSERDRCSLERDIYVGGIRLNELPGSDSKGCISSKELVVHHEEQVHHFDSELLNDRSDEEHGQENQIEKSKCQAEGDRAFKSVEDVDKFELLIQANVPHGEWEETILISSRDLLATDWRDLNMLADLCSQIVQSSEVQGCSLEKRTHLGDMGQYKHPGDGSFEHTLSKGHIGPDEVLHHEKDVLHHDTKMSNENFYEEKGQNHDAQGAGDEDFHKLKTTNAIVIGFTQSVQRNAPNFVEAEEHYDNSGYSDGYCDERTDIAKKKNTFLNSQCRYSQGSLSTMDWEDLNVCVKCNKGGNLLVCSTKSCLVVIHERCSGSNASFSTGDEFYCPFCAYSRAISKYLEIEKYRSLAKRDFAAFVSWGTRKESKKQQQGSSRINQSHLEQDDGLYESNELNKDIAKNMGNHKVGRKMEREQPVLSTLSSVGNPSFGGKTADSVNGTHHNTNDVNQETRSRGEMCQGPKFNGQDHMAAQETLEIQGENATCQIQKKRNGSENHGGNRSKKQDLCPPETNLPREYKCSAHIESAKDQNIFEESNENVVASKYFRRGQKHKTRYSYPALSQLRRKRLPWTTAEEEKLKLILRVLIKEGMRIFCSPNGRCIPWKKIQEFGAAVFDENRSTVDLKDKWRNLCKASLKY